jgi:hypothetical protein
MKFGSCHTTARRLRAFAAVLCMTGWLALLACGKNPAGDDEASNPLKSGVWNPNPWAEQEKTDADLAARIRELETLGYAGGTEPMPGVSGVVTYDPDRAYNGYTIVLSSHNTEARLIDMVGRSLHLWSYDADAPWDHFDAEFDHEPVDFETRRCFHRAWLYPNGDLLAMLYGFGLLKLDKDSNVLWRVPGPVHHDLDVTPDGTIYAMSRRGGIMPQYHPTEPVLDELIVLYTPDGEPVREVSILEAVRNSHFSPMLKSSRPYGEIFHSNTLHVLDGRFAERIPAFKAGNVLTSLRDTDSICVIDMETEKVVWYMRGLWRLQHDPRLTDRGTMTVFDNRGVDLLSPGEPGHVGSRIIEFDPATQQVVWTFTGNNDVQFHSRIVGSSLRLPNGNTFVNETRRGRYLEVTPEGELVWEFINPNQTGPENQYIADLYDVLRYGPDFPFDWLDAPPPSPGGPDAASLPYNPSHPREIAAQ